MNKSKQKGDREERAVVQFHRDLGFHCQRTLESGARSDGSQTWDIDLYLNGMLETPAIGECKIRKDGFKEIYKWLGENDFLSIRANNQERLYVIPERFWENIILRSYQPEGE